MKMTLFDLFFIEGNQNNVSVFFDLTNHLKNTYDYFKSIKAKLLIKNIPYSSRIYIYLNNQLLIYTDCCNLLQNFSLICFIILKNMIKFFTNFLFFFKMKVFFSLKAFIFFNYLIVLLLAHSHKISI